MFETTDQQRPGNGVGPLERDTFEASESDRDWRLEGPTTHLTSPLLIFRPHFRPGLHFSGMTYTVPNCNVRGYVWRWSLSNFVCFWFFQVCPLAIRHTLLGYPLFERSIWFKHHWIDGTGGILQIQCWPTRWCPSSHKLVYKPHYLWLYQTISNANYSY